MAPLTGKHEWEIVCEVAQAMGYPMSYEHPRQIMDEIALTTPTFAGVSFEHLDRVGSLQWPCNAQAPEGTRIMHVDRFVRGKGQLLPTPYVPTTERSTRRYPLILTTGRILTQYNVGAQTRRTANVAWHPEDVLEIHPHDAEVRGVEDGDLVLLASRVGETALRARIADRMPVGVVYTTFHHPVTGANVVTTENSDWATNCPEYKVTAVEVTLKTSDRRPTADRGEAKGEAGLATAVRLADDIAAQFAHLPHDEAVAGIAGHVRSFWDPRMRAQLVATVDAGGEGLDELVLEAAALLR
jgi:formate dehydrogenase major subunit